MYMKNGFRNNCGKKRGCSVTIILPHDSGFGPVLSRVHGTSNDIQKILSLVNLSLDKKLAQEGQMEKMAA
jgi:hypothetical protein